MCIVHSTVLNYAKIISKKWTNENKWKRSVAEKTDRKGRELSPCTFVCTTYNKGCQTIFNSELGMVFNKSPELTLNNSNSTSKPQFSLKEGTKNSCSVEFNIICTGKIPFISLVLKKICIWLPAIFWEPSIWRVLAEHHHREHNALRCLFISLPTR